jgi:hypothetical protein
MIPRGLIISCIARRGAGARTLQTVTYRYTPTRPNPEPPHQPTVPTDPERPRAIPSVPERPRASSSVPERPRGPSAPPTVPDRSARPPRDDRVRVRVAPEDQPAIPGGSKAGYAYQPHTHGKNLVGWRIKATFPTRHRPQERASLA